MSTLLPTALSTATQPPSCPLKGWLDDEVLAGVAAENNLSETAFIVPKDDFYELRWFTPRCEVKLCGHATLAAAFVIFNFLDPGHNLVRFETRRSGALSVSREANLLAMDFLASRPGPVRRRPRLYCRV